MVTYSQDWSAYNEAKTHEDGLFKHFLAELVATIEQPLPTGRGRKGYALREKIFSMAVKQYYKGDLRKTTSILRSLVATDTIERAPSFGSICNFYNDEELTPLLERLITVTSLPLTSAEYTGAIDATGFSTRKYQSWFNHKWGRTSEKKERIWVKLHAAVGCSTNVFFNVKVTEDNVHDSTMFDSVAGNVIKKFDVHEFVADKAYSNRAIIETLHKLNIWPYIPFKKNATGKAGGSFAWRKAYEYFVQNQDNFNKQYHQRSNVETCFHMIKMRFGERLLTKNYRANVNEVLVKVLCHNICVLIQEMHERGIHIQFTGHTGQTA